MSRAEKNAVSIPSGVQVTVQNYQISVTGAKGKLSLTIPSSVSCAQGHEEVKFGATAGAEGLKDRQTLANIGTMRALFSNMLKGVSTGFSKQLEISGVGFKATLKGHQLDLALGTSHPIVYTIPEGIAVSVAEGTKLQISGIDKQLVGQVAADICSYYPVEPYKGKGVRIVGQFVRRKEGKKTA